MTDYYIAVSPTDPADTMGMTYCTELSPVSIGVQNLANESPAVDIREEPSLPRRFP